MRSEYAFRELGANEAALALIEGTEAADEFFPPIRPFAERLQAKAEELAHCPQSSVDHRRRIADLLSRQQPRPGLPAVQQALGELEQGAFALVSGQQVGVCLGPLYTLIKAVSLLALRDYLAVELPGFKFVPLFWASSLDHDFEEIRRCHTLRPDGSLCTITVNQPEGTAGHPVGEIEVTEDAPRTVCGLFSASAATEHSEKLKQLVAAVYRPGSTHGRAFVEHLAAILAEAWLIVFDPQDILAKEMAVPLFTASVRHQKEEARLIEQTTTRLAARGWRPQVAVLHGETNLFCLYDGARDKLVRSGEGFTTKWHGRYFTAEEVIRRAENDPECVSFNVLLRPVYQQLLFPVAAYLGGTSEAAYWAQMYPLFGLYGLPAPLFVPRPGFALVSARQSRLLKRYNLELTDLMLPEHELLRQLAEREIPPGLAQQLQELQQLFSARSRELAREAVKLDPGLGGVLNTLDANFTKHLALVEKKLTQALKRKNEQLGEQVHELYEALMPQGQLQERVVSSLAMLNLYGTQLLSRLREACCFPPVSHRILHL